MDPELYNRFRNCIKCNTFRSHQNVSSLSGQRFTWSLYKSIRSGLKFPTVHAAEMSQTTAAEVNKECKNGNSPEVVISDNEVLNYIAKETGMDRLKKVFMKNNINENSQEFDFIISTAMKSGILVGGYTFVVAFNQRRVEFKRENRATVFRYNFAAAKQAQHVMSKDSLLVGAKWGFKTTAFVGMFVGISELIQVYRNKSTPFEFGIAGAITGSIWRTHSGPKAMFAGGVILGIGGLFVGLITYSLQYYLEQTQELRHFEFVKETLKSEKILQELARKSGETLESV